MHHPHRKKPPHSKRHQGSSQKKSGHLFGLACIILDISDEVAPGPYLGAHIKKLAQGLMETFLRLGIREKIPALLSHIFNATENFLWWKE